MPSHRNRRLKPTAIYNPADFAGLELLQKEGVETPGKGGYS